ncbi:DUF4097 family beta strand repeat-containing protein [Phytoactinopolyspora halotolerans]|uniref:DUF4097 domain-containing protein n=1 Tax=Phytoactinopolyspora halotolerans TaxID=1981512 RepID=A0A6L9S2V0_9ACTN|nr:DUF4097 family beta strand repeat-containing protein [Phytoactinopolyspora halotolerans]NED98757.1 DUF4097 domain-containing protein [Phytoactinopolyspora halotolerans]
MTTSSYRRAFPAPTPISLTVKARSGRVRITAEDVTEATVDAQPSRAGDDDAAEVIERSRVEQHENALSIDLSRRGAGLGVLRDAPVDLNVTVPLSSTVSVQAGSADVTLIGGLGDVVATAGSGDVVVERCADVTLKTGSGDIRVDGATGIEANAGSGDILVQNCSGPIDAETGSGSVHIDHVGDRAEIRASSGDIEIAEMAAVLDARTASGDIRIRRALEGEIAAKTASGDITVAIEAGTVARLDCSSASGRVRSELEPSGEPAGDERKIHVASRAASGSVTIVRAS